MIVRRRREMRTYAASKTMKFQSETLDFHGIDRADGLPPRTRRFGSPRAGPLTRSRARRSSPSRQEHARTKVPECRLAELVRPRIPAACPASRATGTGARRSARPCRHRRSAASAGAVSAAARADGPDRRAGAVSAARQCLAEPCPPGRRVAAGPRGGRRGGRLRPARSRRRRRRLECRRGAALVAARRLSAVVPRRDRCRQLCLAPRCGAHARAVRPAAVRSERRRTSDAAFLDNARSLPKASAGRPPTRRARSACRSPPSAAISTC